MLLLKGIYFFFEPLYSLTIVHKRKLNRVLRCSIILSINYPFTKIIRFQCRD